MMTISSPKQLLAAVQVYQPRSDLNLIRITDIPEPWQGQFKYALRGSACPMFETLGPCAYLHDWQAWVNDEWIGRRGPFAL